MNKKEIRFFNVAKVISRTSEYPRIKIGCCVVKKNRILAVGINLLKSHPMQKYYNRQRCMDINKIYNHIHAELDAVLKVYDKVELKNADIYIYREDHIGIKRMCRPCPACMYMLKKYRLRYIYYTNDNNYVREEINYD